MAAIEQRYAQVLTDLVAKGAISADQLRQELAAVTGLVRDSAPLRAVLASPAVDWEKKKALLEDLAQRMQLSRITRNFLLVTVQRGRAQLIAGMDRAFEQLQLEREGVVQAEIISARTLASDERTAIERQLSRRLGRKLHTRYTIDTGLLGGFIARVGDQVFDGSIGGRLQRLQRALISA